MTNLSYTVEECFAGDFSRLRYIHNFDNDQIDKLKILRDSFFEQFQKAIEEELTQLSLFNDGSDNLK